MCLVLSASPSKMSQTIKALMKVCYIYLYYMDFFPKSLIVGLVDAVNIAANVLSVLVQASYAGVTDADIVVGIDEVDAEDNVGYWVTVNSHLQRQSVTFLEGQELQARTISLEVAVLRFI